MSLTKKQDIDHIARCWRALRWRHRRRVITYEKLSQIIELVEQLGAVDTTGVVPMAHPLDMVQRLRPDSQSPRRISVITCRQNARDTENGLYTVPKVIE